VLAVVGGFRPEAYPVNRRQRVAAELKAGGPDFVIPLQYPGKRFIGIVGLELPAAFVRSSTGTRLTISGH
jgi:hypothetical protein